MGVNRNTRGRREAILRRLNRVGRALVDDLAAEFETTPQTIRKDLNALAESGRVMRFHGGASLLAGTEYTGIEIRERIACEQKALIGQAAAALVPDNASLMINTGTTTAAAARLLSGHSGLRALLDSVSLANEMKAFAGIELMVPGGVVRPGDGTIVGEPAVEFIRQFRFDLALVGVAAISMDGTLLDFDLREAAIARAMMENARTVILLADSTKFERMAPVRVGHLEQVRTLITDAGHPPELEALCCACEADMIVADGAASRRRGKDGIDRT